MKANLKALMMIPVLLASLAGDLFSHGVPEGNRSHTPRVGGSHHSRHPRHKVHVPNGKWLMKAHRGRCR